MRKSTDTGSTFGEVISLSNITMPGGWLQNAQVSASGNNLYLGFGGKNESGEFSSALFERSIDGGRTFSNPVVLDDPAMEGKGSFGLNKLAAAEQHVYVLIDYYDEALQHSTILFRSSADEGKSFGKAIKLFGWPESSDSYAEMATSGGGRNVYVVASGRHNFDGYIGVPFRRSIDAGKSFGDVIDLNSGSNALVFAPRVASSGNNVYATWSELDPANKNVTHAYFRASNDGGRTFGERIKLDTISEHSDETINSDFIQVAANKGSGNVYVMWWNVHFSPDLTKENDHLLVRTSMDGGRNFDDAIDLTGNQTRHAAGIGESAIVASDATGNRSDKGVYAIWVADTSFPQASSRVFLKRSADGGKTFEEAKLANVDDGNLAANVRLASAGNNVYVVWDSGSPGKHGIFFESSNDAGRTFSNVVDLVPAKTPEFHPATVLAMLGGLMMGIIAIFKKFGRASR
jgi:hypothetical protein